MTKRNDDFGDLVRRAFEDRVIDDPDHLVLKRLRGEVAELNFDDLVRIAFKDRVIDDPNHLVLKRLRGEC